jgi:cytochrome c-type biogenesis protein CcmH/NrfF
MVGLIEISNDGEFLVATLMTKKSNFRLSLALIGFALLPFLFAPIAFTQVFSPEVKKVAEDFVCQCSCNHQLNACGMVNCESGVPLQQEIAAYLKEGKARQQIREIFISKYSNLILSAPTTHGFDLTAWTMPFVMLFLGFVLVYFLIRVWAHRKPALAGEGHGVAPPVPEPYQQQIEKELKDFDS